MYCKDSILTLVYRYDSIFNYIDGGNKLENVEKDSPVKIEFAQLKQKRDYDRRHRITIFSVEDFVYVLKMKKGYKA